MEQSVFDWTLIRIAIALLKLRQKNERFFSDRILIGNQMNDLYEWNLISKFTNIMKIWIKKDQSHKITENIKLSMSPMRTFQYQKLNSPGKLTYQKHGNHLNVTSKFDTVLHESQDIKTFAIERSEYQFVTSRKDVETSFRRGTFAANSQVQQNVKLVSVTDTKLLNDLSNNEILNIDQHGEISYQITESKIQENKRHNF